MQADFLCTEQCDDLEFNNWATEWAHESQRAQIETDNVLSRIQGNLNECRKILRDGHHIETPQSKAIDAMLVKLNNFICSGSRAGDLRAIVELDGALGGETDLLDASDYLAKWHEKRQTV